MSQSRLGELLVREKLISLQQLRKAQDEQRKSGQNLGYTLAKLGYISDGEITNFLSSQYKLPSVNLDEYEIEADVIKLLSREICEKHKIIPVSRSGSSLIVAMADPTNLNATDDVKFLTGYNVDPVVCSESAIMGAISLYSSMGATGGGVAHTTHLGGLVAAYLYLKGGRTNLLAEIRYRLARWRINKSRRRFDVYSGGRSQDTNRRVH